MTKKNIHQKQKATKYQTQASGQKNFRQQSPAKNLKRKMPITQHRG